MSQYESYKEYVEMVKRNGWGEPMTKEQWEAARKHGH